MPFRPATITLRAWGLAAVTLATVSLAFPQPAIAQLPATFNIPGAVTRPPTVAPPIKPGGGNGGNGNGGNGHNGNDKCRPNGGYYYYPWFGGSGYVVQQTQYVPVPTEPVQPPPDPGYIVVPPSVYTTISIPSASGDGRQLVVDVIRGARENATQQPSAPIASVRPEDVTAALNLLKPDLSSEKLLELLGMPDERVQLQALELLAARGEAGLATLKQGATSANGNVRAVSLLALTQAAANPQRLVLAQEVVGILSDALGDANVEVRRIAVGGIGVLSSAGDEDSLVGRLMGTLRDPDDEVRAQAVQSLAMIKESAIAPLAKALGSTSDQLRNAASEALGLIGPAALPALLAALESPAAEVRYSAAAAVGDMGVAAEAALPILRRLAKDDKDPNVRYYAQSALRKIDR